MTLGLERHECRYLLEAFKNEARIKAYLLSQIASRDLAQDLLHKIYEKLLAAGAPDGSNIRSVFSYSLAIARNLVCDHLRIPRATSLEDIGELPIDRHARSAEDVVEREEQSRRLSEAIDGLPEPCRQTIRLRLDDELTYEEIAKAIGTSEGMVSHYLRRAIRLLSAALGAPSSQEKPKDRARRTCTED